MRMFATDVDLQLAELCVAQRATRQHALDGLLEHALGMGFQHLFERGRTDAARILGMPVVNLVLELVAGRLHLLGIDDDDRSEEHTSELQSLMRISYAVFCLKKKKK